MTDLLSIGRFAALTGLTPKALRLYDGLGLLRPAAVDLTSGYRYYRPEQIADARRIGMLRSLHLPLAEIGVLLRSENREEIEACLSAHRKRLKDSLASYRQALDRLPSTDEWYTQRRKDDDVTATTTDYKCSFCSKPHHEIRRLIAGPGGVYICNECIDLCNTILADAEHKEKETEPGA